MLSDSTTQGQQLRSDPVTTHGRGRGRGLRAAAVLRDDVVVAIRQDDPDCWLHVFHFSQPWRHNAYRLPQASAIAVRSAEKSRGPGHFTLTLDSPSAVLEGCIDERLQLSQLQGRPLLNNQSSPPASGLDIPFQIQQFECLFVLAYPDVTVRRRGRQYFLAVCDMARRELVIFSLDLCHNLGSIDISSCPQLQTIFNNHNLYYKDTAARTPFVWSFNSFLSLLSIHTISKHQVLESVPSNTEPSPSYAVQSQAQDTSKRDQSVVRFPRGKNPGSGYMSSTGQNSEGIRKPNKESSNVQLLKPTREKRRARIRNGRHSRMFAVVPHKTRQTDSESCTEQPHGTAGKDWKNLSEPDRTRNQVVVQKSKIFEWTSLHRSFHQRAKCVCCKAFKVLVNTLLSYNRHEVRSDSTPLNQDAMLRRKIAKRVLDLSRQLIDYLAIKASEATSECRDATYQKLKEEVRKSLTYDPNTFHQNVCRAVEEMWTTIKKICFIAVVASRSARHSKRLLASKHRDALPGKKNLPRSHQPMLRIHKAEESRRHLGMNTLSHSTEKLKAPPSCDRTNVDTKSKQQSLSTDYPINKELKDAEYSRRQRADKNHQTINISQPSSQPACVGGEMELPSPEPEQFQSPTHRALYEAELARRLRRGENIPS